MIKALLYAVKSTAQLHFIANLSLAKPIIEFYRAMQQIQNRVKYQLNMCLLQTLIVKQT
jgi:hypothetical protein